MHNTYTEERENVAGGVAVIIVTPDLQASIGIQIQ